MYEFLIHVYLTCMCTHVQDVYIYICIRIYIYTHTRLLCMYIISNSARPEAYRSYVLVYYTRVSTLVCMCMSTHNDTMCQHVICTYYMCVSTNNMCKKHTHNKLCTQTNTLQTQRDIMRVEHARAKPDLHGYQSPLKSQRLAASPLVGKIEFARVSSWDLDDSESSWYSDELCISDVWY